MSAGLITVLILVGLLIIAGLVIAWLWNARKNDKALIVAATNINAELKKTISARDQLIKKLQEADSAANKQKDAMASGSVSDRINAANSVLSDIAKPKAGPGKS